MIPLDSLWPSDDLLLLLFLSDLPIDLIFNVLDHAHQRLTVWRVHYFEDFEFPYHRDGQRFVRFLQYLQ